MSEFASNEDIEASVASWTVYRPVATLMIVVAVVVFGYISFKRLAVNLMPELSYPTLTIRTELTGAAPAEVEESITRPLEEIVRTVEGVVGISSTSRAGQSEIILRFGWDTDMDFVTQKVRERVQIVPLPEDADRPLLLRYDPALDPILRIGVAGDIPLSELRQVVEQDVQRPLEKVEGVAMVKVRGGVEEVVRVDLDPGRMGILGVTPEEVGQRLAAENVNLAGGALNEGDVTYLVRTLNAFKTIQEVEDLTVAYPNAVPVKLGQIANVYRGAQEREVITRMGGPGRLQESVIVEVYKEADANLVDVSKRVRLAIDGSKEQLQQRARTLAKDRGLLIAGGAITIASKDGGFATGFPPRRLNFIKEQLPKKVEISVLSDQSTFIERSIDEVTQTALLGALFAVFVLFLFLRNPWSTVIIAVSIPVSVVAAFGALRLAGVTLNVMSLGGIALGVGMLVDNSIVVLESIFRCREEGDGLFEAALRGTKEVAGAVTASTLTTTAVFLPIVFVEGIAGQIFGDLALSVVFALLASLAVAIFFVPMLSAREPSTPDPEMVRSSLRELWRLPRALGHTKADWAEWRASATGARVFLTPLVAVFLLVRTIVLTLLEVVFGQIGLGLVLGLAGLSSLIAGLAVKLANTIVIGPALSAFDYGYQALERAYVPILKGALRVRAMVTLVAVVAFAWSVYQFGNLGTELLPSMNQGEFSVSIALPVGTRLEETSALVTRLETNLKDIEAIEHFATTVGVEATDVQASDEGEHTARIAIRLQPSEDPKSAEREVMSIVRSEAQRIPAAQVEILRPTLFTLQTPLEVIITGDDLRILRLVGNEMASAMASMKQLADIRTNLGRGYPEVQVRFNRDRLALYGLTARQVGESVRNQVRGSEPTKIRQDETDLTILVRTDPNQLPDVEALRDLVIRPAAEGQAEIRLSSVASLDVAEGPSEIRRVEGSRAAVIEAEVPLVSLSDAADALRSEVNRTAVPSGVGVRVGGQSDEMARSTESLLFALWLAIFLVYVVLASKFESLRGPFVILLSIPMGLVGVSLALSVMGLNVSVLVFIGLIMLAGIVVNNAIVLVDYINQLRDRGLEMDEAIVEACRIRLRPVLITTLTTVLGLLPMALGLGEGAELRKPMAITVIAGLSSSTLLTLLVVPTLYALMMSVVIRREPTPAE